MSNPKRIREPNMKNYNFNDIYNKIKNTDLENKTTKITIDGWVVLIVPKDTIMYRGVKVTDYKHTQYLDNSEGFIYFGNFDVAAVYAFGDANMGGTNEAGKIISLIAKQNIIFLDLSVMSNFQKIFETNPPNEIVLDLKLSYGYDNTETNPTIKRNSDRDADYRLSKWFCAFFYKNNLPFQGYGYNLIANFHMEYILCTNNVSSYLIPTPFEYRWFDFYREKYIFNSKTKSLNSNNREDYIFETKDGLLTNNVINIDMVYNTLGELTDEGAVISTKRNVNFEYGSYLPSNNAYHKCDRILFQEPIFSFWMISLKNHRFKYVKEFIPKLFKIKEDFFPPNTIKRAHTSPNTTSIPHKLKPKRCPIGTRKNKDGICENIKRAPTPPNTTSIPHKLKPKRCPVGTRKNKHGICEKKT